jgi:L-Ala-D/L-Glu epimerase
MRLSRLLFASVPITFRSTFAHRAAVRARAENVIVLAEDDDGYFGLGEGCPRSYVTGENVTSALSFLARHRDDIMSCIQGADALDVWMRNNATDIDANPSAFCALELALLDLFARRCNQSIESYLRLHAVSSSLATSAVYGTGALPTFLARIVQFNALRMRDAKLKLSGHATNDGVRAALLSVFGKVRLDANNHWRDWRGACNGLRFARRHAWAVEEPIQRRDWAGMALLSQETGLAIVLDESLTRTEDIDSVPEHGNFVLNLRVSKMGGLKRSLQALSSARRRGLNVIVGAQVGETSILARAGVVAASAAGDALLAFEGGYGTWLLERDAASPSLTFGPDGRISVLGSTLDAAGAGLRPTAEVLNLLVGRSDGAADLA